MNRLLLTSKGEKTVCADRDDRGGAKGFWRGFRSTGYFLWLPASVAINLMCAFDDSRFAPFNALVALFCGTVFAALARLGHYDETVAELRASFGFSPRQSPTAERDAR